MATLNTTINASAFRAALYAAAKKDVRYYLNGVLLDFPAGRIVATNGHILFCGAIARQDHPPIIVPREVVETALKALGRKNEKRFSIDVEVTTPDSATVPTVRLAVPGALAAGSCIDGRFPDYARIVPREPSGELALFNPDLLTDARDALNAYTGQSVCGYTLKHNGESTALMAARDCFCVVMPARIDADADLAWYYGADEQAAAA